MKINISFSAAEEMTKILERLSMGGKVTKQEILNFLNDDEGCKKQFQFYGENINKNDYIEMIFAITRNEKFETENFILQKMYNALKRIYSNLELLHKKLDNIKEFDFKAMESKLFSTLPEGTVLDLNIFFCLDGFNGGSIVDKNTMCLDVLFWPSKKNIEKEIEGVVLHEFHHIGMLYWLNKNERRNNILEKNDKSSLAVKLVEAILGEGAAVYFFNEEQDLYELVLEGYGEELAKGFKEDYKESWNNIDEKLRELNKLLLELLYDSNENYDTLKNSVGEYSYMHENEEALDKVIGKYMCDLIEKALGRQALIDSFKNLQNFLIHYNEGCKRLGKEGLDTEVINNWKKLW